MGLMLTLVMPYLGGFRQAALRSQARRLAGRATYMFDEATGHKLVLRLVFDLDHNGYAALQLDPYAVQPVFAPDTSLAGRPVMMPAAIRIRDVTIEGIGTVNRGMVATNFYPEGYVDATVVHLDDASGDVMTLEISPLTGQVAIISGDVMPSGNAAVNLHRRRARGFTLIEVMVAIAILGIALMGLLGLHHQSMQSVIRAQQATRASMLAQAVMTEAELERFPDLGYYQRQFRGVVPRRSSPISAGNGWSRSRARFPTFAR